MSSDRCRGQSSGRGEADARRFAHVPSGPSTLIKGHLTGGASRLAALLLPQILPVFSVVAPCHPGAALRDLVLVQRGQATSTLPALENVMAGTLNLWRSRLARHGG